MGCSSICLRHLAFWRLWLGRGQGIRGHAQELAKEVPVLDLASPQKHGRLRARVRRPLDKALAYQLEALGRDLNEELVVTHQGHDLLIAVKRPLAEHLARPHAGQLGELVEEEVDRALSGRHGF